MSIMEKVVSAVTPTESDEARQEARAKARNAAGADDWLSQVLRQHQQIESAFESARSGNDSAARLAACKELALLLTGHTTAEESVLYPALAQFGEKSRAAMSYTEHANAKTLLGELEYLSPMSQEYIEKLARLRDAVLHHMYEEEGTRFLELKQKVDAADQTRLTRRYQEEYERYVGSDTNWRRPPQPGMQPATSPPISH